MWDPAPAEEDIGHVSGALAHETSENESFIVGGSRARPVVRNRLLNGQLVEEWILIDATITAISDLQSPQNVLGPIDDAEASTLAPRSCIRIFRGST